MFNSKSSTSDANHASFWKDLRPVLIPEKKWHYIFHLIVLLIGVSYWVASLVKLDEASWAEIIMYRPEGESDYWPTVTSLSKLNFGDPSDIEYYGKGVRGGVVADLGPSALAYAIFGNAGYVVTDVVLSLGYFLAVTLFLRRCNFGSFSSLFVGSALATCSLQGLISKLAGVFQEKVLGFLGITTTEWGFPPLGLQIFGKRIVRPMFTEIFVVLLFYFLIKLWQERRLPSLRRGVAVGALLGILAQGDPFNLSAVGLLLGWVILSITFENHMKIPWRFGAGLVLGALSTGWPMLVLQYFQSPDLPVMFGFGNYSRLSLFPLPGYGPLLRVAVVCVLAWIVVLAAKRRKAAGQTPERTVAIFCVALVAAGWLAQPAHLFLLGKGAQIYHFLINTLPILYSYAVVILLFNCLKLALPADFEAFVRKFESSPGLAGGVVLALLLSVEIVMGMEESLNCVAWLRNARYEGGVPWLAYGDNYRPCFRALDKEFRQNPTLRQARSISTFCIEVNILLTAFHDKRTYTPYGVTAMSLEEVEARLCEMGKILRLKPEQFANFIQQHYIMNCWLGAAKYWFATDYKFSTDDDYPTEAILALKQMPKESPFCLVMPKSEVQRIMNKYIAILLKKSDNSLYPDAIILTTLEKSVGLVPNPELYKQLYESPVFVVYTKLP